MTMTCALVEVKLLGEIIGYKMNTVLHATLTWNDIYIHESMHFAMLDLDCEHTSEVAINIRTC